MKEGEIEGEPKRESEVEKWRETLGKRESERARV